MRAVRAASLAVGDDDVTYLRRAARRAPQYLALYDDPAKRQQQKYQEQEDVCFRFEQLSS